MIDGLWGEEPPETGKKAVQVHVSNLRRALGEGFPLLTAPGGYVVNGELLELDASWVEASIAEARRAARTDPAGAFDQLSEALQEWRGNPYGDLASEKALEAEVARLHELRMVAVEQRFDLALRLGRHAELLGQLEALTYEHPFRERLHALHMLALYRSGRQSDALRAYQRIRMTLAEELGLDPSVELQALEQQILEQASELDLSDDLFSERFAFLYTDIEDSTAMWEADAELMQAALEQHDRLLEAAVNGRSGTVFKGTGDGVLAVFDSIDEAVGAAVDAQRALASHDWPTTRPIAVRMAVDHGAASARNGDYFGPVLNRVARVMASGHGGQVLLPSSVAHGVEQPTRVLGTADYKGVGRVEVSQLTIAGLRSEFPDLRTDRSPKPTTRQGFGQAIRGYEIRERLGEGAHGIVYRAYQASVGREVAVKVIRSEFANQPGFVKRFEAEAQYVAQLEHPYIVSLYDYWRDPDGAYLAMQWLRGGSLAKAIELGDWRPPAALRLLDQVGQALDYAHRNGVVHRDLKPANVLLDDEGNGYLTDFGIATDHIEASGAQVGGSVAYLAPEEMAGGPVGTPADIYGLGLLTYEIFTGLRPGLGGQPEPITGRRPDLPAALDPVLARATDRDPSQRFPRVEDFLRALRQAFGAHVVTQHSASVGEIRNPYKGLRAFAETDSADFFGRDGALGNLVEQVEASRLTTVVGPSGSGKSSLVKAGLIPAARREGVAGRAVVVAEMYPGSFPFEELEAALLRIAVDRPSSLVDELLSDDRGLLRVSKQILPEDTDLLLVVDQFEELFSLTADDGRRRAFLSMLATAASDERGRVRAVLTIRADFFDRPLEYPDFGELVQRSLVAVTIPSDHELAAAIAQPAHGAGLQLEDGLVSAVLSDVSREPGGLPLLQYAMTDLVERQTGGVLTIDAYEAGGGVVGSLAGRAEEIYLDLPQSAQEAARELFVRLVAVDEDSDDTRKRARVSDLRALGLRMSALDAVMDEYGSFRLISFDHDPVTRGPTVEVAHEALIREWPRYREWIDERREDLLLDRRLSLTADEWEAHEREPSFLLHAGRLARYEEWASTTELHLGPSEREFLDESRRAANESAAYRAQRRRRVLGLVSILAVCALALAATAFVQRNRANEAAGTAEDLRTAAELRAAQERARSLNLEAQAATLVDPDLALLLSTHVQQAAEAAAAAGSAARPNLMDTMVSAIRADHLVRRVGIDPLFPLLGRLGAYSADGESFVTWVPGDFDRVRVYDIATGQVRWDRSVPGSAVGTLGWDPSSGDVLTFGGDGSMRRWDAQTGDQLTAETFADVPIFASFTDSHLALHIVQNQGARQTGEAVLAEFDVEVTSWASGATTLRLPGVVAASLSPNGRWIASFTFDATLEIFDLRSGELTAAVDKGEVLDLAKIAWSAEGNSLWWIRPDGALAVINAEDGAVRVVATDYASDPRGLEASPDGTLLAIVDNDNTVRILSTDSLAPVMTLRGHAATPIGAAWAPDGRGLLTASADGEGFVWELARPQGLSQELWAPTAVYPEHAAAVGGGLVFVGDGSGRSAVLSPVDGRVVAAVESPRAIARVKAAASPDGRVVATSFDLDIALIDVATGTVETLGGIGGDNPLVFSPEGSLLVAARAGRSLANGWFEGSRTSVIDVRTGDVVSEFGQFFSEAAAFADGLLLVAGQRREGAGLTEPREIRVVDPNTGSVVARQTVGATCFQDMAVSDDQSLLALSGCDGALWVYATADLLSPIAAEPLSVTSTKDGLNVLSLHWVGSSQLLAGGADGRIRSLRPDLTEQWSFDTGVPVTVMVVRNGLVYFPAAESRGSGEYGLLGVPHDEDAVLDLVAGLATRSLTEAECDRYLGAPCP